MPVCETDKRHDKPHHILSVVYIVVPDISNNCFYLTKARLVFSQNFRCFFRKVCVKSNKISTFAININFNAKNVYMKFHLHYEARRTSEKSVGISCAIQQATRLNALHVRKSFCNAKRTARQVKPRGSIYLQSGRMVSMDRMKKIIQNF